MWSEIEYEGRRTREYDRTFFKKMKWELSLQGEAGVSWSAWEGTAVGEGISGKGD